MQCAVQCSVLPGTCETGGGRGAVCRAGGREQTAVHQDLSFGALGGQFGDSACAQKYHRQIFTESALWVDSVYKSRCPSVCLSVCLYVCQKDGAKIRLNGNFTRGDIHTDTQTDRQTDIATYRLNRPRGLPSNYAFWLEERESGNSNPFAPIRLLTSSCCCRS